METRSAIPAELRRKILVEAGHRCAISTCRSLIVEVHHIEPWEKCKKHEYNNLIALCPNCHTRVHKDEIDKKSLRLYKNNLRFLYDKFTTFEIDILFDLYHVPEDKMFNFPANFEILIKRILEAKYVNFIRNTRQLMIQGMQANHNFLKISPSGREFVKQLSEEDIGY